jgi:hypothetical protein
LTRAVPILLAIGVALVLASSAQAAGVHGRPVARPASDPCVDVLSKTKGSTWAKVAAGLSCRLRPAVWAAKCAKGVGTAFSAPLKALKIIKDAKTAKGLYDLRRVPKKYRPYAKLYNDLVLSPISKNAPKGFRTGKDIWDRVQNAKSIKEVILLLPNIRKALSGADYSQFALDISEVLDIDDCVKLLAGQDPSVPDSMTLVPGKIDPLAPLDPGIVPPNLPYLDPAPDGDQSDHATGSVSIANNNGQMVVQVVGFPTGVTPFFCHAGGASEYPTGGTVTARGEVNITSANQSWSSGLCAGGHNTNMWIGFQGTDGHDYYSNQVVIDVAATPGAAASAFGSNGLMSLQLTNFPMGTNYYFCHQGDPSQYPFGGAIIGRGQLGVASPSGSYGPLCSGSGNAWIGVQGADGHDYYSNQITL